jgi:hypothetical protein
MRRSLFVLAVALTASVAAGCSGQRSDVFGTVKYLGKPVKGGTIILIAPDNRTYPARIQDDGSYRVAGVPRGRIEVSVQGGQARVPPRPTPGAKGAEPASIEFEKTADKQKQAALPPPPPDGSQIPAQYIDPARSGLAFDLTRPEQEYSLDLK